MTAPASQCAPTSAGALTGSSTGTTVTGGSGAGGVFGSYAQLVAATDADAYGFICWAGANVEDNQYQIAVGAAASEQNIAHIFGPGLLGQSLAVSVPVFVPAGSRLSVRTANAGSMTPSEFSVTLIRSNTKSALASYGRLVGYSGTGVPLICDCGATAHTKGAYAQVIASTTNAARGFSLMLVNSNANSTALEALIDVAVGAAASETIILADARIKSPGYRDPSFEIGPIWTPIPAGTRIAVRGQSNQTVLAERSPRVGIILWE